jgi:hypothetical protein
MRNAGLLAGSDMRSGGQLPYSRRLPDNVPWGASVRQSTQCPMNRLSFFFSFELSNQRVPLKPPLGGVPEVGDQLPPKPLPARFHCAEWSCVVLSDSPRRRNGPGRDWPVMPNDSLGRQVRPPSGGIYQLKPHSPPCTIFSCDDLPNSR